jgi:hemolysin-activating ACP:hemolysin acyltransferase
MSANGAASTDAGQDGAARAQLGAGPQAGEQPQLDPQMVERIMALRSRMHAVFAQVTMAMMSTPRYRHHTLAELQHLVLEPMIRDRIAVATPPHKEGEPEPLPAGIAIWAKVSEEVDKKIREQIKAGAFPVRLKAEEWDSGDIAWLLDVIAPTKEQATAVVKNFGQVVKDGKLFVHTRISISTAK